MEEDIRVQCLVFIVHDNDHLRNERSPTCTRKLRSSTAQPRRCKAPRMLRNSVSASRPLAKAFVMLPEDFSRDRRSLLELFQQNDILVVNSENIARLLVGNDHLEVFEILLEDSPSASINPLCLCTPQKYLNVVELLFANVKIRFKYERANTIARLAVDKMNLKFIKRLLVCGEVYLEFGCHGIFGSYNGTLLHMAMLNGCHHLARKLIEYGTDIHSNMSFVGSTLHLAARLSSPLIQELIDKGAPVDRCYDGTTPLYYASTAEAAEVLLQNGANVNGVSKVRQTKTTALLRAVDGGNIRLIKTLLHYGADVQCKDHRSRSILDLAYQSKKTDVLKFLLEYCFSVVHTNLQYPFKEFVEFLSKEVTRLGPGRISNCFFVAARHSVRMAVLFEHFLGYRTITPSFYGQPLVQNIHEEFVKMTKLKCGGTDISLCDILTKSPNQIASLLRNEAFSDDVGSRDLVTQFRAYGRILKYQLEKGMQRKNIQQEAAKICTRLFSNFKCLPDEVQGMIIRHLSYQDVMILKRICTPLKT